MLKITCFSKKSLLQALACGTILGVFCVCPGTALAAGKTGDVVETDMLGANLWTQNLDTGKQKTIGDSFGLSEFVGLHYYFVDEVRVGLALQFTETIAPPPPSGKDAFTTFAFLPQIGWNFAKPFFAQLTVAVPIRTNGVNQVDFGLQPVFGASFPLAQNLSFTAALEIPFYLQLEHTVGLTPLVGIGWKL